MGNRLSSIQPALLDQHLPGRAGYFVLDWGFSHHFTHAAFVRVDEFHFRGDHALPAPVYLHATVHPDVHFKADPSHDTVLLEDAAGRVICHADITRTEERWQARIRSGVNVIGRAHGSLGVHTSSQLVEAALVALVRQAAARGR